MEQAVVIPRAASTFVQLVECAELLSFVELGDGRLSSGVQLCRRHSELGCRGTGAGLPMHVDALRELRFLSAPTALFEFSFTSLPPIGGRTQPLCLRATEAGVAHALIFWWTAELADGVSLSTMPDRSNPNWWGPGSWQGSVL